MKRLHTLATTAVLSLATLTFSAQAQATTSWFSDLFDGFSSLFQDSKHHDWDADWDRDYRKDWDKDWEHDWDKQWSGNWKRDWDDLKKWGHGNGHNGKWFICHRTGSHRNPYVIIEVSTSGKHAHLAHGDSLSFSDRGNGRCGASAPDPKITSLSLANDEISVNATTTLSWTSTNATSCKLDGNTLPASGTTNVGPYSSPGNKNLTLTCTGSGGSDSETIKLKVKHGAAQAPQVTLTLEPSQIAVGAKAKLSWDATNAKSCTLQGSGSLYWKSFSIPIDDSGYYMKGPFSKPGEATYTVTCTGYGGSDSASVTLTVGPATPPPAPTVTFSVAENEIEVGTGTTTASWSSTNATSCSLGGGATAGSVTVGPFSTTGQQSLTVTCTGAGGTASQTVTVNVIDTTPAPTERLCMSSDFVGNGLETWIVDYNLETGGFTGTASRPGEPALTGGVVPAAGVPIEEALYMPGTQIDVRAGSMLGLSNGLTFANGNVGADGYAQYQIDLYAQSAPGQAIGNTRLVVHGETFCTQLGGQTPPPR